MKFNNVNFENNNNKWQFYVFATIKCFVLAVAITIVLSFAFGYKYLNILTDSMSPTMPRGTLIIIANKPKENIKVGDVATYSYTGETLVTHRIVSINLEKGCVYTRGDAENQNAEPEEVKFSQIKGIVVAHFPHLGSVLNGIKENIIIVAVLVLLLILMLQLN